MHVRRLFWTFALTVSLSGALAADQGAGASPSPAAKPANPFRNEMTFLSAFLQQALLAVTNNTLDEIPEAFEPVQKAREQAEEALRSGAYQPPVNGKELKALGAQHSAFYRSVDGLIRAAKADDLVGTSKQLGAVLNGCTQCHTRFRFPPAGK